MKKSKQMCNGCRNDFYNGNNDLGVSSCWSFDGATVQNKIKIPIHQRPPYHQKPIKVLSCFHQRGYVFDSPIKS